MFRRFLKGIVRYSLCISNLGFITTLKILYYRFIINNKEILLITKKFGKIYWHTSNDKVIDHLYTPQVEIYKKNSKISIETIIDLGANIGLETIRFKKLYEDSAIFAVEADKENFNRLKKNTYHLNKVIVENVAIWSGEKKLLLKKKSNDNNQTFFLEESLNENYDIIGKNFNEWLNKNKIKKIDILKIDIEGSEKFMFDETSNNWINRVNCIILETPDYESPGLTSKIFQILNRNNLNFNLYINGENLVFIKENLDWLPRFIEKY